MEADTLEDRIEAFVTSATPEESNAHLRSAHELLQGALLELRNQRSELIQAATYGEQLLQQIQKNSHVDEQAADERRQLALQVKLLQHKLRAMEQDAVAFASEQEALKSQVTANESLLAVEMQRAKRLERRAAQLERDHQEAESAATFLRAENMELTCMLQQYEKHLRQLELAQEEPQLYSEANRPMSVQSTPARPTLLGKDPDLSLETDSQCSGDLASGLNISVISPTKVPPLKLPTQLTFREDSVAEIQPNVEENKDVANLDQDAGGKKLHRAASASDSESEPLTSNRRDSTAAELLSARRNRYFAAAAGAMATPRFYAFTPRLCNELLRQTPSGLASARAPPANLTLSMLPSARVPSSTVLDCLKTAPLQALLRGACQALGPLKAQFGELKQETREWATMLQVYGEQLTQCLQQLSSSLLTAQKMAHDKQVEVQALGKLTDELYAELAQTKARYAAAQFETESMIMAVENARHLQPAVLPPPQPDDPDVPLSCNSSNHSLSEFRAPRAGSWWPFSRPSVASHSSVTSAK